jgi:hypothetical protein
VIGKALTFLRKRLDDYVRAELAGGNEPVADKVVLLDGDKMNPITFQEGAISELLIKVEEERLLRAADPYLSVQSDGRPARKQPDLRLILHLLFVARFKQYETGWDYLTKVIECLNMNRTFDRSNSPDLPPGVDRLGVELVSQTFGEQNDVWSALQIAYHPSVLYRLQLVVLRDTRPTPRPEVLPPVVIDLHRTSRL